MLQHPVSHTRRFTSRFETPEHVWVYWSADGREDIARVRNVSLGGAFIETSASKKVDSTMKLDFLVQEGQISADAVVRRAEPSRGLALKFTKMTEAEQSRLTALVNRLRQTR
jgi:PilZ domain